MELGHESDGDGKKVVVGQVEGCKSGKAVGGGRFEGRELIVACER